MIVQLKILLLTFPVALLLLALCYGTGELVYRVVSVGNEKGSHRGIPVAVFWKLTGGLFILIGLYAAFVTGFRTSLLPVPILGVALLTTENLFAGKKWNEKKSRLLNSPGLFLFMGILVYWIFYALHYMPASGKIGFIGGDTLFYARAGDYLNYSGSENAGLNYMEQSRGNVEQYHYGDLWIIALVQELTGLSPALITHLVVYPVLASIFCLGVLGYLWPAITGKYRHFYWLILLGGLTSGISYLYPSYFHPRSISLSFSITSYPKLFFAGIILIGIILSLQKKSWHGSLLMASAGSILFINIAPAVLISLAGLFLIVKLRRFSMPSIKPLPLVLSILALTYYFLFYKINPAADLPAGGHPFRLRTFINITGSVVLQFLPFIPFLFLSAMLWVHKKRKNQGLGITIDVLFIAMIPFTGLLCWGLTYSITPEAMQFFYNVWIPVTAIYIYLTVWNVLRHLGSKWVILAVSLLVLSVALNWKPVWGFNVVSRKDIASVSALLKKHQPGTFVNLRSHSEFKTTTQRNTIYTYPLQYITYLYPSYQNISLNAPFVPDDPGSNYPVYEKNILASVPFSQFIKKRDTLVPMEEYAYLFITESRLRYLCVSPDTLLPVNLRPLVKDSIHLSDGWHIYYLEK